MKKKLFRNGFLTRVISLAVALVLLLSYCPTVFPAHAAEEGTTLYLKPNANWLKDNARFAVYFWKDGGSSAWLDLADKNEDGYYEVEFPAGYTNLIFCRMNPATSENDWTNMWNQTADLKLTDGYNCCVIADDAWDGAGEWIVFTPEETEEPTTPPTNPNAKYYVAGDSALCGSNWKENDSANLMTHVSGDVYEKEYTNVAAGTYNLKVTDGTWDNSWGDNGQNYTFVVSASCDVTVSFNSNSKTVSVTGEHVGKETGLEITTMHAVGNGSGAWLGGKNWDVAANVMTETSSNVYEITFQGVPAGSAYEFKFAANAAWTHSWGGGGAAGEAVYNGQNIKLTVPYTNADVTLKLDMTGYNHSTKTGATYSVTMTEVTEVPEATYIVAGTAGLCGSEWNAADTNNKMARQADGTYAKTFTGIEAGSYEFKVTNGSWDQSWGNGASNYTFTLDKKSDVTIVFDPATGAITVTFTPVAEIPDDYTTVTIHFLKPEAWGSTINAYLWSTGAVPGYEDYNTWPGKAVAANATHSGWYDLVVATEEPMAFNFIFNDGGNQTADLNTGAVTGDTELWVVGNDVLTTAPGEWSGDYTYTAHIHFQKPADWGTTVNAWIWDANGAIPGYEQYQTTWPGSPIEADEVNSGWYNVSVTVEENTGFSFIFNDGTKQTGDLSTGTLDVTTHLWVVDGNVLKSAPAGWLDSSRTVHVPGTFPGPSWDAGSNQMTYDAELGLYVYTFQDVPAANYEYKIAINKSWSENYGAGGVKDGPNMSVSVPETMDVTVYYNDNSHLSATSVTYIFADITLSGADIPAGTKLKDKDLSGIYSASVDMKAGTYTDVKLTYNGKDYLFSEIEVAEDKLVTFYMDPVIEIYYCDAVDLPIDADSVFFDSQDETYKAPFGAAATGEEITFSIDTGADITSAVLVIKGLGSYPMALNEAAPAAAEETKRWSCTLSIAQIGEYDYYFAISNGSVVGIYGDDDGYYGEGTLTELTSVNPYDLVVYEAGFETPDWMKNAVIYQIFPDRFFDGDMTNNQAQTWARGDVDYEYITDWYTLPENPEQEAILDKDTYLSSGAHYGDGEWSNEIYGGDLEGITQRIDYLKALGVNVIYLNPVFWSISNHRYDAVDYTMIDPILGNLGDFQELVRVAEENDMHIILDGVFNHVSDDSVYFDRYYKFLGKSEKIGAYPYWAYVYDYMNDNGADQATAEAAAKAYFGENYGITDYSYTEWFGVSSTTMAGTVDEIGLRAGKEVYSYEGWWGYDSMPVIKSTNGSEYQTGNWAEEIISGSNSVNAYWIGKGMDGWRLDVANEVSDETWQNFRDSVKALDSDAVIIGEIWDDATKYLKGDMYDSVMNYVFRSAVTSYAMGTNAVDTAKTMEKLRERYPEEAFYAMMNLVGSHDTTRILSYLDGIGDDRNQKDFDSAFPTYEKTSDLAKDRQYLVSFLQFTYAGAPTIYYGDEIGMVGSDDPDDRRAFEWGKGNRELVEWYATLAAVRRAYPALRTGSIEMLELESQNLMGFVRSDANDTLTVIANNSQSAKTVSLKGSYINVLTGETFDGTVPALNGVILVSAEDAKEITVNLSDLAPAYDASYIVAERPDHAHQWDEGTVTKEATCTEDGEVTYKCQVCEETKPETIPASGHSYEAVVTAPTCTAQGYTTYTCACGDSYVGDYVDPIDHNVVLQESEEATCDLNGYEYYACEYCGGQEYTIILEATGHSYADGKCTVCGAEDPDANKGWFGGWLGDLLDRWFGSYDPEKPFKPIWGFNWNWFPLWK